VEIGVINYHLDVSAFETNLLKILFYSIPSMILLWRCVQGWRLGLSGKIVALIALITGTGAAWLLGSSASALIPSGTFAFPFVAELAGTILIGLSVYLCVRFLFLRKRNKAEDVVNIEMRILGVVLGLAESLLLIWAIALIVRWSAEVSEAIALAQSPEGISPESVLQEEIPKLNFVSRATTYWNHRSLASSSNKLIDKLDPIPKAFYDLSKNLVVLTRNPKAMDEFAQMPEVIRFMEDPSMIRLKHNQQIRELHFSGNHLRLAKHPEVKKTLQDPAFLKRLQNAGMEQALDRTINKMRESKQK
jgi:uncharacterized membrane protein required for colicin V production